jgi:dTDP-4-amino-4,6-dideoxygalactose transaminase
MKVPFCDLLRNYEDQKTEIDAAIQQVIQSTEFIGFPINTFVNDFESKFAKYLGCSRFVGTANGTDSIEMILKAWNIGPGDEVIVPANTWISTAEAVKTVGAQVVFADCDENYLISLSDLERKINKKTKVVIPVHLYGLPVDMQRIWDLAKSKDLLVLEDCAQAHGATWGEKRLGSWGHAGSFSFFPSKNLGAFGDAGGVSTNDEELAERLRRLGNHGRSEREDHLFEGRNSRLDGLQASILSAKLKHLDKAIERRREAARFYSSKLANDDLVLPSEDSLRMSVFHLYVVRLPNHCSQREVLKRMHEEGIECKVHYPKALPFTTAYAHLNHKEKDFPKAFSFQSRILSLPIFPEITEDQQSYVIEKLKAAIVSKS